MKGPLKNTYYMVSNVGLLLSYFLIFFNRKKDIIFVPNLLFYLIFMTYWIEKYSLEHSWLEYLHRKLLKKGMFFWKLNSNCSKIVILRDMKALRFSPQLEIILALDFTVQNDITQLISLVYGCGIFKALILSLIQITQPYTKLIQ